MRDSCFVTEVAILAVEGAMVGGPELLVMVREVMVIVLMEAWAQLGTGGTVMRVAEVQSIEMIVMELVDLPNEDRVECRSSRTKLMFRLWAAGCMRGWANVRVRLP
jgi:hypothetical protein